MVSKLNAKSNLPTVEAAHSRGGAIYREQQVDWLRVLTHPETGDRWVLEERPDADLVGLTDAERLEIIERLGMHPLSHGP